MGDSYTATAFPGDGKGGGKACRLELAPTALVLDFPGAPVSWDYGSLHLDKSGDHGEFLLLTCLGDSTFKGSLTLQDPVFRKVLAGKVQGANREFLLHFDHYLKKDVTRKWRNLALAGLFSVLIGAGGYWGLSYGVAAFAAKHLPVETEVKWGKMMAKAQLAGEKAVAAGPVSEAAAIILKRLVRALPENPGYPFTLHVIQSPVVNAFALPGGQMVLFTGLMKQAKSPEEVAGVLAHEMQHVLHRHVVRRIVQSMGWRIWFDVLFGDTDLSGVAEGAGQILELSYSRDQETEADLDGARLLVRAGLPVKPLEDFFKRLSKEETAKGGKIPAFISDHPSNDKRVEALDKLAKELKPTQLRLFTEIDWPKVQKSLKKL